jgi:hypothetical protein
MNATPRPLYPRVWPGTQCTGDYMKMWISIESNCLVVVGASETVKDGDVFEDET